MIQKNIYICITQHYSKKMKAIKLSGVIAISFLALTSCKNHAFLPQTQNTPVFTEAKEVEINTTLSHRTFDAQLAFSPVKNIGLMANLAWSIDGMQTYEGGFGGYNKFENKLYLGLYAGYAYCDFNNTAKKEFHTIFSWENWYYNNDIHLKAHRIFIQPQISMLFNDKISLTFSVKTSNWIFTQYDYRVDTYEHRSGSTDPNDPNSKWERIYSDTIYIKNKNNFTFEPALTFKAGGKYAKVMLQTGFYGMSYYDKFAALPYRKIFPLFYRIGVNLTLPQKKVETPVDYNK